MQLPTVATGTTVLSLLLILLSLSLPPTSSAHNITKILEKFPDFSTFNHYLTATHLAPEINSRETITVCAIDNAAMSDLLAKHPSIYTIKNVLSFHVLLDYFGAKKLTRSPTGRLSPPPCSRPPGPRAGRPDTVQISVIQISKILASSEAEAPTPGPSQMNLTSKMSAHGCKVFAETLLGSAAEKTYDDNIDGGLTVFCPGDDAFKNFLPNQQVRFHGTERRRGSDVEDEARDGNDTGTVIDEQPVAIFSIDKVLLPRELFKGPAPTPAPAPAPDTVADAPKPAKKGKHLSPPAADSPADSPDGDAADQTADNSGAVRFNGPTFIAVGLGLCLGLLLQL
ncbi:hypothetical protein C3L33_09750, partial [Rhododendron williamsianum]